MGCDGHGGGGKATGTEKWGRARRKGGQRKGGTGTEKRGKAMGTERESC